MRVLVVGLRGIPDVQGGVETHAQHLYPLLAKMGFEVEVLCRSPYWNDVGGVQWNGVLRTKLWAPKATGLEAFVHTLLGIAYAAVKRPDLLHIHAIGPGLFTPVARLAGLKVIFTHHGPDYEREKWGFVGRAVLKIGERWAVRYAHTTICISETIRRSVAHLKPDGTTTVPNGVPRPDLIAAGAECSQYGLKTGRYFLLVSRFVPEKRHLDLVAAFRRAVVRDWKLVLVGAWDENNPYCARVKEAAGKDPRIVLTGRKSGDGLGEVYANAGAFVLPSSHEGLPIALLEALSYGLPVVVSNIAPHLEMGLPEDSYFDLGDIDSLARKLERLASGEQLWGSRETRKEWVLGRYCWDSIAEKTAQTYRL